LFGARPLKRVIQNKVQNAVAKQILAGELKEGDTVIIERVKDDFAVKKG
jgi:ATP-dependent Clp protease ATP-binding subunit ClpA